MVKRSPILPVSLSTLGYFLTTGGVALAQVVPDNTINTLVNQNSNTAEITGGNTQGGNLFHSFQDFSVPIGNEAFFNNSTNIVNIFSRVTGGNISNIDGAIRNNGSANLFLINPAGIIFGENARLDIGGSFLGSTSNSILFPDGVEFSATDTQVEPVLTINAPIGLGFRDEPGEIINNSVANNGRGLSVNPGNNISLLGGNITFNGGIATAPGGTIDLGGLSAAEEINIDGNNFSFPDGVERSNISLTDRAIVNVRGNNGGGINVNANNLEFTSAGQFLAGIDTNAGFEGAQAGNISINTNNIIAGGDSQIRNETLGIGNAGDINITTGNLDFTEGSGLAASTFGRGNAGNININATENVFFDLDFGGINTNVGLQRNDTVIADSVGDAGNININARSLSLTNGARLVSKTSGIGNAGNINVDITESIFIDGEGITPVTINDFTFVFRSGIFTQATPDGIGNAGDININAREFTLNNRALVAADSSTVGDAGNITIDAVESVLFGLDTIILTQIQEDAEGNGGDITINTKSLSLVDSFLLSDSKGRGDAGNIVINASETVFLQDAPDTDTSLFNEGSLIISGVGILGDETEGNAGNIEINTKSLTSEGSSFIIAQTNGMGDGGDIIINSEESVFLNGSSRILSQVQENAIGNGGEINITSPIINLNGLSAISTTTLAGGEGIAGNINLTSSNITLKDTAIVDALTENNFNGGNITISTDTLNLLGGGKIVTAADAVGNAGNISLDVEESINIAGNNPQFEQFITELSQDEIFRNDEDNDTRPDDRFRFATPSSILTVLGDSSGLFANTSVNSTGNGGNITIGNPNRFSLADTALISVGSEGSGSAGSLLIDAQSLFLDNGSLIAETPFGVGGNITLSLADNLELNNGSLISSQATGDASGGNINIDSEFIIAFPNQNNDIIANADRGEGGNISVSTQAILGLEERNSVPINNTNDIDASSQFGLDGSINLNTPDVNPLQGVTELPTNVVEPQETTAQACNVSQRTVRSGLTVTGRGGVIAPPDLPLNSANLVIDGKVDNYTSFIPQAIVTSQGNIQPARGVKVNQQGEVILTAYRTINSDDRIFDTKRNCKT